VLPDGRCLEIVGFYSRWSVCGVVVGGRVGNLVYPAVDVGRHEGSVDSLIVPLGKRAVQMNIRLPDVEDMLFRRVAIGFELWPTGRRGHAGGDGAAVCGTQPVAGKRPNARVLMGAA
jgi:hypothetical protein